MLYADQISYSTLHAKIQFQIFSWISCRFNIALIENHYIKSTHSVKALSINEFAKTQQFLSTF